MCPVLHSDMPPDMIAQSTLPGVQPVEGLWLRCDEAYGGQMARRATLFSERPEDVFAQPAEADAAGEELLKTVLTHLPELGFEVTNDGVQCPDGRSVRRENDPALLYLGRLVQCDFCLLEKVADEHVLKAAALCFPASWRLAEKIGRPLVGVHEPVEEYDDDLARRVQRLFDGVRPGRPLWRYNQLWYEDPDLYQPRSAQEPRRLDKGPGTSGFLRMERQTILRLPVTGWVVFAIHSYVLRPQDTPFV